MTPQRLDRARTLLCLLQDSIRDTNPVLAGQIRPLLKRRMEEYF